MWREALLVLNFVVVLLACFFSVKVLKVQFLVPLDMIQVLLLCLICLQYVGDMMEYI